MEKIYCVYCHLNKINGHRYIGITGELDPSKRWGINGIRYKNNTRFYRAIEKYGWNNFEHIILEDGLTQIEAEELEQYYIKLYNTITPYGYNLTYGGEHNKQISEETRKKLHDTHIGIKPSEQTRQRMSISRTGHKGYNCKAVWMCDKQTHERIKFFNSFTEAAKYLNKDAAYSHIGKVCNGERLSAYGYFWEYALKRGDDLSQS